VHRIARFVAEQRDVVSFFRHVDIPHEIVFQTVLMNSELRDTIVSDNLRWTRKAAGDPRDPRLRGAASLAEVFARKFDVDQDENVLDLIDRRLLGVEARPESSRAVLWNG
jgi:hypothetical protein